MEQPVHILGSLVSAPSHRGGDHSSKLTSAIYNVVVIPLY